MYREMTRDVLVHSQGFLLGEHVGTMASGHTASMNRRVRTASAAALDL